MARYQIAESDLQFAREFMEVPIGYHSPGLQRVLNRMRGADWEFKYVLLVKERHSRWQLAKLPAERGSKINPVDGAEYSNLLDAERDIFKRRWKDLTGQDLDAQLASDE